MIEKEDLDQLKDVFITRQECDENMSEIYAELSKESTRLAVIETKLSQIVWILTAVGGGIITMLLKMFFGG